MISMKAPEGKPEKFRFNKKTNEFYNMNGEIYAIGNGEESSPISPSRLSNLTAKGRELLKKKSSSECFADIKKLFQSYSTTEEFQVQFEEKDEDFVDITVISKIMGQDDFERKLKLLKDFRTLSHFIAKSIKDK